MDPRSIDEPDLAEAANVPHEAQRGGGLRGALACPRTLALLLIVATLAVYWPVRNCDYLYYDDPTYTTSNPHVRRGLTLDGLGWAFGVGYASNWHPLTWVSHMVDAELFGSGPMGPHVVNVVLHAADAVLLFWVLRGMTGAHWRSAFVAGLFALHPLHVESVAWVSERKDVLSTLFWFLTMLWYGRYVEAVRSGGGRKGLWYGLAVGSYALGLMSKPMLVTVPFVLLLLDYWPLRRTEGAGAKAWLRLVWEKAPFLALSAASCLLTLLAQRRALGSLTRFPLSARLANAAVSYARYLGKAFWPSNLALPYPYPQHWPAGEVLIALILLVAVSVAVWWLGRKAAFLAAGWLWFLGTLIPVIGIVQVGNQAMADRYAYVPLVGLFIAVAWGAGMLVIRWRLSKVAAVAAALVLAACAARTVDQLRYWRNSETLFGHTLGLTPFNPAARDNLGYYLYDHGRWAEAIQVFQKELEMDPSDYVAYDDLGFCYSNEGRLDEAMKNYHRALEIHPDDPNALNNLGTAFTRRGRLSEAIQCFEAALRLNPEYADARNNLGVVLDEAGRTAEAIGQYRQVLRLAPDDAHAHNNLANALVGQGRVDEAISHYRQALELDPKLTQAWNNLGWMLAERGRIADAIACYGSALEVKPEDATLHRNLGSILLRAGRNEEALRALAEAARLDPIDPEAHLMLGEALSRLGRRGEAVAQLREALRLKPAYPEARRLMADLGAPVSE
jgi:tetratricopeptide (TPR) repeat protein